MIPLKNKWLSRRRFLCCAAGGLGTAVALPALEAMFSSDSAYAQSGTGKPRFLAIYQPNGHHAERFAPAASGLRNLNFAQASCRPLEPFMEHITILKALNGTQQDSGGGNGHHVAIVSWLTGKPVASDQIKTHTPSADVYIANHYENTAPTGRKQHAAIAGSPYWDSVTNGRLNDDMKSWLATDMSGNRMLSSTDLEAHFDRMFSGFDPDTSQEQRNARSEFKKSVLDFVLADVARVENRIGASDRQVLKSYFTNIRELENRLSQPSPMLGQVDKPTDLTFSRKWPTDRIKNGTNEFIDVHWQDTMRLLRVAFQAETVRSVSYMLEAEFGPSGHRSMNLPNSHLASHNKTDAYATRDTLYSNVFVEMLKLFKDTPAGPSNLLDETMIVWGAGIGIVHSRDDQMTVLAGHTGGRIKHGALRDYQNQASAMPLIRTLMQHMGVLREDQGFGDARPGEVIDLTT